MNPHAGPSRRQTQIAEIMAHRAADFLQKESNRLSLVTVTRADVSPDLKSVLIFLSVLPASAEEDVLLFAKRNTVEFKAYLKKHASLKTLPHIEFEIDYGEKNRQRIDDLTRQ